MEIDPVGGATHFLTVPVFDSGLLGEGATAESAEQQGRCQEYP